MAFITNLSSRLIVGWQTSRSLRSDLTIDALEMAVKNRQRAGADLKRHRRLGRLGRLDG